MEMGLSTRKGLPRVNLEFFEPWTGDVFALGFVKPMELCRGLPRMGPGFCGLVRISKHGVGFYESCVQRKCCALTYMALAVGGMYWKRTDVFLHTCLLQSCMY